MPKKKKVIAVISQNDGHNVVFDGDYKILYRANGDYWIDFAEKKFIERPFELENALNEFLAQDEDEIILSTNFELAICALFEIAETTNNKIAVDLLENLFPDKIFGKKEEEVYCLNTCDEWKTYSSFRLHGVYTSFGELMKGVAKLIVKGHVRVEDKELFDNGNTAKEINDSTEYCFVDVLQLNKLVI